MKNTFFGKELNSFKFTTTKHKLRNFGLFIFVLGDHGSISSTLPHFSPTVVPKMLGRFPIILGPCPIIMKPFPKMLGITLQTKNLSQNVGTLSHNLGTLSQKEGTLPKIKEPQEK